MKLHQKTHPAGRRGAPAIRGYADIEAFSSDDFTAAFLFVSDKLHTVFAIPTVLKKGAVVNEHMQRLMLASLGYFQKDKNKALSFTFRFQALLKLVASRAVDDWIQKHDGNEDLSVYHPSLLAVAGRAPLQNDGSFASASFIETLRGTSTVEEAANSAHPELDDPIDEPTAARRIAA